MLGGFFEGEGFIDVDPEKEALVGEQVHSLWSSPHPGILEEEVFIDQIITITVLLPDIPKDLVLSIVDLDTPKYPTLTFLTFRL